ncbi:hypothetical protein [Halorubrum amylolyticum]|uniref:hypothetical protein n=1 Tax=Halorubrum amylolyticum TaxID=2508724 RepID=UPI001F5088A6|nr:hypothetical protein [Halorubrum amylolyticum]
MCPPQRALDDLPGTERLTTRIAEESRLLDRAERAASASELVLAPVQLHHRNLQRRLREAARPQGAFEFTDPESVGRTVVAAADGSTAALDRVDRLSLLRSLARDGADLPAALRSLLVGGGDAGARRAERVRSEIESLTNHHPVRVEALRDAATGLDAPIDGDAARLVDGALRAEAALRDRGRAAVSTTALLRRATRRIDRSGGDAWDAAFPEAERVSIVGVGALSAPYVDLVSALLASTAVAVEIHFRPGTGAFLDARLPELLSVPDPGREVAP